MACFEDDDIFDFIDNNVNEEVLPDFEQEGKDEDNAA